MTFGCLSPRMRRWVNCNAAPRPQRFPPVVRRGRKCPLMQLLPRINTLCTPNPDVYRSSYREPKICQRALKYKPTPRMMQLAQPKIYEGGNFIVVRGVSPNALKYEPTECIKRLAEPPKKPVMFFRDITKVNPAALTCTPSERTNTLAKPRVYPKPYNPPPVKKSALTATASPRTCTLAKPRVFNIPFINPFAVKKCALTYTASPAIERLAKPREYKLAELSAFNLFDLFRPPPRRKSCDTGQNSRRPRQKKREFGFTISVGF